MTTENSPRARLARAVQILDQPDGTPLDRFKVAYREHLLGFRAKDFSPEAAKRWTELYETLFTWTVGQSGNQRPKHPYDVLEDWQVDDLVRLVHELNAAVALGDQGLPSL